MKQRKKPDIQQFFAELVIDWPEANRMGWSETSVINGVWQILRDANIKDRPLQILYLRYIEGWAYKKIGDHFGVTVERIRQIVAKNLRGARHPSRRRRIVALLKGESTVTYWPVPFPSSAELALCDFSTRAVNCLMNLGIKDPKDLEKWTESDLLKCRTLGKRTLKEIIAVLRARGMSLKKERNSDELVKFSCICDVLGWDYSTQEGSYIDFLEDRKSIDFANPERTLQRQRAGKIKVSQEELKIFRVGLGGQIRITVERI